MTDMKMFICPSTTTPVGTYISGGTVAAGNLDYHYIPGLNAARVTSDSAILFDSAQGSGAGTTTTDNHDKFGNMLFGDGHVGSNVGTATGNWLALNKTGWDSAGFGIPTEANGSSGESAVKAASAAQIVN